MSKIQELLKRFFLDKDGHLTLIQFPNLSANLTVGLLLLSWVTSGWLHTTFRLAAVTTGLWWAYQEVRHGANYFRRILGLVVTLLLLKGLLIK